MAESLLGGTLSVGPSVGPQHINLTQISAQDETQISAQNETQNSAQNETQNSAQILTQISAQNFG